MAKNKSRDCAAEEVRIQITPMIDVTFLLLIFFLCSIKFKMLDGKLATYLPKDRGAASSYPHLLERIEISLKKSLPGPLGFQVFFNGLRMKDLRELFFRLRAILETDDDLKAVIHPGQGIEYGDVIKVVNECLRAGLREITFSRPRL
ncbi:MAG: ExbD/TolR family protein [Planctomycetota bacterium]|jgi:biopolymer transport protein ExbD